MYDNMTTWSALWAFYTSTQSHSHTCASENYYFMYGTASTWKTKSIEGTWLSATVWIEWQTMTLSSTLHDLTHFNLPPSFCVRKRKLRRQRDNEIQLENIFTKSGNCVYCFYSYEIICYMYNNLLTPSLFSHHVRVCSKLYSTSTEAWCVYKYKWLVSCAIRYPIKPININVNTFCMSHVKLNPHIHIQTQRDPSLPFVHHIRQAKFSKPVDFIYLLNSLLPFPIL